jgi:poly(3-hydroxybutyrate) depolymerase
MLWEVMFEMLGELLKVTGEIIRVFFDILKSVFKLFAKKKDEAGKTKPMLTKEQQEEADEAAAEAARTRNEIFLICLILAFIGGGAMMFPQVRHFVFNLFRPSEMVEMQRNNFPMGQYTTPQFYTKKKFSFDDDGMKRTISYYIYAPHTGGQRLPLVVALHGKEGVAQAAIHLRMGAMQKLFPSFILIPQSPAEKIWDAPARYSGEEGIAYPKEVPGPEGRSLEDVLMLVANLSQVYPIDENRIYIVGCDTGGSGVYGALAHYGGVFAAGVTAGGSWGFPDRSKISKTPLLILHGVNDTAVPPAFARNMSKLIAAVGGKVSYYEFPGIGHDCDNPNFYSQVVWNWLFAQSRPEAE